MKTIEVLEERELGKIKYTLTKGGACNDLCPFEEGKDRVCIGSASCEECDSCIEYNEENQFVICKKQMEEDEMKKKNEGKLRLFVEKSNADRFITIDENFLVIVDTDRDRYVNVYTRDIYHFWKNFNEVKFNPEFPDAPVAEPKEDSKVKRNIAKIYYKKLADGMIKIEKFENILNLSEISEKYGEEVVRLYRHGKIFYPRTTGSIQLVNRGNNCGILHTGSIISHEEFGEIVSFMKECGTNLICSINNEKNFREVKIVEI